MSTVHKDSFPQNENERNVSNTTDPSSPFEGLNTTESLSVLNDRNFLEDLEYIEVDTDRSLAAEQQENTETLTAVKTDTKEEHKEIDAADTEKFISADTERIVSANDEGDFVYLSESKKKINEVEGNFVQFDQVIVPRGVNMLNTREEMEKRFK